MKRTILFSLAVLSAFLLNAAVEISNGSTTLYYELNNTKNIATLVPSEGDPYSGVIDIPENIQHDGTTYEVATIAEKAFFNCKDLSEVSIPRTITKIGGHAFKGCEQLRTVNYNANNCVSAASVAGKSVSSAFEDCKSITTINFGGDVVNIPEYLFWGCTGLTEITIPENVQQIAGAAFIDCNAITKVTINAIKCIRMTSDNNRPAFVGAPITTVVFGELATTIPDYAFNGCKTLTSITIPENITQIGGAAFGNCPNLTSVTFNARNCSVAHSVVGDNITPAFNNPAITRVEFGEHVNNIPDYIFWGCKGLTDVVFGNNVETIGAAAFYGCTSLRAIRIPENVTSIGGNAFANCKSLNILNFDAINCVNMVTMEGVLPKPAFDNKSLNMITFGNRVEVIPNFAFMGCTNLKTIEIPTSVRNIGYKAFFGCKALQSITIPENVTSIDGLAFAECNNLVDVTFNAKRCTGASKIENGSTFSAFHDVKIKNAIIGENVEILPDYLFSGCANLAAINIPASIKTIGDNTFFGCKNLTTITYNAERCEETKAFNNSSVVNLILGNNVKSIPNYAFMDCNRLNDVILPTSLETIGKYAFLNCANIKKVTLPESLRTIEGGAFENCGNLREVYFNAIDCKAIVEYADTTGIIPVFHNSSIRKVVLGPKVESIPDYMFFQCHDIEEATLVNKTLKSIGKYAFYEARTLKYIYIGETVETIGGAAFGECELLAAVDFNAINCTSASTLEGDSVLYPFIGDNSIEVINIGKKVTSLPEGIFYNAQYITEVAITKNITSLGGLAFGNCPMLSLVYFDATECPNAHSTIQGKNYGPFEGCNELIEASISVKINTLPDYLFSGCAGLKKIELPEKVTRIGDYAFRGCLALKKITIPETVETIGAGAFEGAGLTSVSLHEFISEIGKDAFKDCKALATIRLKKKNRYYTMVGADLYTADKATVVARPYGK